MKNLIASTGILMLLILFCSVKAQEFPWPTHLGEPKIIEPGPPGVINETISEDTTTTGERIHNHYILRRGQTYYYTRRIENTGYSLMVTSEEGEGELPIIKALGPQQGQEEAERPFQVMGNLYLKDLTIYGFDNGGNYTDNATVRLAANNIVLVVKNVNFDFNRRSAIRINSEGCKVYVEDCIFGNQGIASRLQQGFAVNLNKNGTVLLHMRNNTFYNHHNSIIQNWWPVRYNKMIFENNTVLNTGTGGMKLGQPDTLIIKNNLFVNIGILGEGFSGVINNSGEPYYYFSLDKNFTDTTQTTVLDPMLVQISNNHFYLDPAVAALLPDSSDKATETLFSPYTKTFWDENTNIIKNEAFTFTNFPAEEKDYKAYIDDYYTFAEPPVAEMPEFDTDFRQFDFSYPSTHEAYTAGTYGTPLGDLNWFGINMAVEVESPVYYCTGETSEALQAYGTELTWYDSINGTGQSTPFFPATDTAGEHTYFVTQTIDSVESEKVPIHVIVREYKITHVDSVTSCGSATSLKATTNYKGKGTESFMWEGDYGSSSESTFRFTAFQEGNILIEATTSTGCFADTLLSVSLLPANAEAWLSSVSTQVTNVNKIEWRLRNAELIDSVFILGKPEITGTDYDILARLDSTKSYYIDTRDSEIQSNSLYHINIKDVCGHKIDLSYPSHKAPRLKVSEESNGWLLEWENYIGRESNQILLLRGSSPENLTPVYSTYYNNSYLDISPLNDSAYYKVKVTFRNDMLGDAFDVAYSNVVMTVPLNTLIFDESGSGNLNIYPNPTNDLINIETVGIQNPENYTLKVITLTGNVVHISNLTSENAQLNLDDFGATGLYFIELWDDKGVRIANRKLILE